MPRAAGNRSSSIEQSEVVVSTCEADWTGVDAACVVSDASETTYYKRGARSAYVEIAAASAVGIQAYGASASAALNLAAWPAAWGYNYLKYWIRPTVALTADQVRIGLSNAADNLGTEYYLPIPALTANAWTLVRTPFSSCVTGAGDFATNLTSVDSIHIYLVDTAYAGILYLDDIRACRYETSGASAITIPETQTLGNTNLDLTHCELFYLPWRSRLISLDELPIDMTLTGYMGSNAGAWTSSDPLQARRRFFSGQTIEPLEECCSAVALRYEADMAAPVFTDSDTWTAEFIGLSVRE